eukprot:2234489-Pleurochrysis_carterae.AAC.3
MLYRGLIVPYGLIYAYRGGNFLHCVKSERPARAGGSTKRTWSCNSTKLLSRTLDLRGSAKYAMGSSARGFKSGGLFIRVVTVLMTTRIDFAGVRTLKSNRAYFSYMYALVDEDAIARRRRLKTSNAGSCRWSRRT